MDFLGRGLLVATTALLLTALGFAQSNVAKGDQYGNDVYHTADSDQQGIDVFQSADRDHYGDNVFHTADPQFMKEATQDAMSKIHLAYLALQNAQNEQVKSFALQILSDYGTAQKDLFNIAYQEIVLLPHTFDAKNLDTFEALSQLHGAAFDKAYMKAMLHDDQTATSRFKQEATKGDAWAGHTLPTLESNLKEAQKVALAVGVHSTVTSEEQRTPSASKAINTVSQEP
jgi:putative membrane protein